MGIGQSAVSATEQQSLFFQEPGLPDRIGRVNVDYSAVGDILTRATGFMDAYDFTLNPYSGCSFGCTYCYAAFFSHSTKKRDSWGLWVTVKENAANLLLKRRNSLDGEAHLHEQRDRPVPTH